MSNDESSESSLVTPVAVAGFDRREVERWLSTVAALRGPVTWSQLRGGNSNLTYLLRDAAGRELVVRRPPEGALQPKAHDMWREFRIIEALWPTSVPVPEPVAYCDDRAVADTHFYVMGRAAGSALYTAAESEAWLHQPWRQQAGQAFVDVLAALHAVDPEEAGLGDLGRPDGYVARQTSRWYGAWVAQAGVAGLDDPRVHEVHDLLVERAPAQPRSALVHGDYGPHNVLFDGQGMITAVLDWEIATLGDPLADLGYSVNAWAGPGDDPVDRPESATGLPGFPTRDDLVGRYVEITGADMSHLTYYRVFNYWKRACILQGVYSRYQAGQKSSDGVDVPGIRVRMEKFLGAAEALAGDVV